MTKRDIGKHGEDIVKEYYEEQGYDCLDSNFALSDGEIDLIFGKDESLHFVEVKVIDRVDDIFDYLSKKKLKFLEKTINYYLSYKKVPFSYKDVLVDVAFVKNGEVYEVYQNVFLN